jgi:cell fate (sporulation/competence/biofilm development) regulator YlbF (YheA/YmcA/DUF963 family)
MTNTLPLLNLKGLCTLKRPKYKPSLRTAPLARWITAAVAALCLTLTACDHKPNYNDEIGALQNKLYMLTGAIDAVRDEQATIDRQHDSLFLNYRQLHKQFVRLDSLAFIHANDSAAIVAIKAEQAKLTQNMASLVNAMQTLGQLFNEMNNIVYSLHDEVVVIQGQIVQIQAQLAALPVYDTVRVQEFVGDGNLLYQAHGPIAPGETISFQIDSARFRIWSDGGSVEPIH